MEKPTVEDCRILEMKRVTDPRGSLTFIEGGVQLPFDIKRVFYIYDVPTGESRGAHAHKELHQFLVSMSGSFDVILDDGRNKKTVHLNRPWLGLHIPPMIWAAETNFDAGTICMVLASDKYKREDYYYEYEEFKKARSNP